MPEARTVRPPKTGLIRGDMGDHPYGLGAYEIAINPRANRENSEFRFKVDDRFGPQLTDHRDHSLHFSRHAAEELRDALTLALEWRQDDE